MKIIKLLSLFVLILVFNGCEVSPNHSVRVKNSYSETIYNMKVGSVGYDSVSTGEVTIYKPVAEGSHTLSGNTKTGSNLNGSISVTGNGTHKWTLEILPTGNLAIQEDK